MKKFYSLFLGIFILYSILILPESAEAQCPGTVMNCCQTYSGTVSQNAGSWSLYPACSKNEPGSEAVYSFTPTTTNAYTFTASSSGGDADFFLMSDCGNTGTNLTGGCWDEGSINVPLTAGTTYYIIVDNGYNTSASDADYLLFVDCGKPVQSSCTNMGFEDSFTGWSGTQGVSVTGDANDPTPIYIPEVCGTTGGNFALMTGGTDPIGGFNCVYNGSTSLRLSTVQTHDDDGETYTAASIQQTFQVTQSNTEFIYNYAVVFYDGGHDDYDQPFFQVDILQQDGNPVDCGFYQVVAPGTGFITSSGNSSITYKPWTSVSVNLTPYIGQYVTIKFTASDCAQGAHFGYAYIDCSCAPYGIIPPDTICAGEAAILTAPAGSAYLWAPGGETTQTITVYPTQTTTYTCSITTIANSPCYFSLPVTVLVNSVSTVTAGSNSPVCLGSNLNLSANPIGGANYSWSGPNGFSSSDQNPTISAVTTAASGTYTVTVSGIGACTTTSTVNVNVDQLLINATVINNVSCNGGNDGSGTVAISSGIPPYTYTWSPSGGNLQTASDLAAGTYSVLVTDSAGCQANGSLTMSEPPLLVAVISGSTDAGCYGAQTGSATVSVSGGTQPYSYNWLPAGGTGATTTGIGAGTYTVTVTDAKGCTATTTVIINQPQLLVADISNSTNVSCFGTSTGNATVTATGGTQPYSYNWSPAGGSAATTTNVPSGTYTVTVTDSHGCTATTSVVITQPTLLVATISDTTNIHCFGTSTGNATVTASGGTPTYSYNWLPSGGTAATTTTLPAGTYTVTVTDAYGCTATAQVNITQSSQIQISLSPDDENCPGMCDGSIASSVVGGHPTYTYLWNTTPGQTTPTAQNLCPGTYIVTIIDSYSCTATDDATIGTSASVSADFTADPQSGVIPLTVNFAYTGSGGVQFYWDFGDGSSGTGPNVSHTYSSINQYTVILYITSAAPEFCTDTMSLIIDAIQPSSLIVPNVFTPNSDGHNDYFNIESEGIGVFECSIYNRWGKKIYEWNDISQGWDGRTNGGALVADGVYYYIIYARGNDSVEYDLNGTVTILR